MNRQRWSSWLRRVAGLLRTLGWTATLYLVASPWRDLGGLITERLRWLGWFVLYACVVLGFALGDYLREARPPRSLRESLRLERRLLGWPAMLTAMWLAVLQSFGQRDAAGVLFTGFLAYWAGIDVAVGAMPWMEGKACGDDAACRTSVRDAGPLPPWES